MFADTDYFFSARPAYPWSVYPVGLPALAAVAVGLVVLTLWTYLRHPLATRRRVAVILGLRLLALVLALVTAVRPSVGVQEDPKIPSTLVVGIDLSESMTVADEFNAQTRIAAVRAVLARCESILEELKTEQNVNVVFYGFGDSAFAEPAGAYDPAAAAAAKRSDYGAYLNRTLEKWQTERFVRGHLIIGDGADNGTTFNAAAEAARWRAVAPLHTFAVGKDTTDSKARDVAIVAANPDPTPVPVKNDLTLKILVNAAGFVGARVPVKVLFDDKQVALEMVTLAKAVGNEIRIPLKAPDKPGEVKVRVEIPVEAVPGDAAPGNNVLETYLTVTKEGVRVLLVDRLRFENAHLRRALQAEKRFDVAQALRQDDTPPRPDERELFDFDTRGYDVIILGNVSARQLKAVDPKLPEKIRDLVDKKGAGLLMIGGDATFGGTPERPLDDGWKGTAIEDLLPASISRFPPADPRLYRGEDNRFQTVPTADGLRFLLKVGATEDASKQLWDRLNAAEPYRRITAINMLGEPKPGATVYALADAGRAVFPAGPRQDEALKKPPYLLVGWQRGDGNRGRVLAFAGYDSFQWKAFGLGGASPSRDGIEIHSQFWRRMVLWLAHQEEDDGAAYARPEYRRLPVNAKQTVKIGLRTAGGADVANAVFAAKILAPGQKPEDAQTRPVIADPAGGAKIIFDPPTAGEYTVLLTATGTDTAGKELKGDAVARFLAYPDTSDELVRAAADPDYLQKLAAAGGGKAYRLEDLPAYLKELKTQPLDIAKPKPRFIPDWRRDHSHGFLTAWLVAFAVVLGAEWGLRRAWGLV